MHIVELPNCVFCYSIVNFSAITWWLIIQYHVLPYQQLLQNNLSYIWTKIACKNTYNLGNLVKILGIVTFCHKLIGSREGYGVVHRDMSGFFLHMVTKLNRPGAWPQGRVVRSKLNNMDRCEAPPNTCPKIKPKFLMTLKPCMVHCSATLGKIAWAWA